jgi:hypothetical protein
MEERSGFVWKVWCFCIGLLLGLALWYTGNGSSGLFTLAALLVFIPLGWLLLEGFVAFLFWMKFF